MAEKKHLPSETSHLFTLVREAALANPFSERRAALDLAIGGFPAGQAKPQGIEKTIEAVEAKFRDLERDGKLDIAAYSGQERTLVEFGCWFCLFYRYRKDFDRIISAQIESDARHGRLSPETVKVPFAGEAFSFLQQRGFDLDTTRRIFELCYQVRRAYFFMVQGLTGRSQAMKKLRHDVWDSIFTHDMDLYIQYLWNRMEDFSTLILGDTGTGKSAVAAIIGRSGHIPFDVKKQRFAESFTRSFVAINLSQFPESLIESELFGHKKGAFTGAVEQYQGVLSQCGTHGAILLDEIGDITLPIQIKLLQVLQDRVYYPVGSHKPEAFRGRVIAATNRALDDLRATGRFREDFYFRLCSDVIVVPPLQDRLREGQEELDDLLAFILRRMVGKDSPELAARVRGVIDKNLGPDYPWHGNVRELEQCARRVLLHGDYRGDKRPLAQDIQSRLAAALDSGGMPASRLLAGYCRMLYQRHGTFEEVSRRTCLDRRTASKYASAWDEEEEPPMPEKPE